jgi:molybdopterin synthase sulfur carrier subunit
MPTVFVPPRLRRLTGGVEQLAAAGTTVGELVADVERRYPGFRAAVVEGDEIASGIAVAIDGDIVAGGLGERVAVDSEVHFVPALGGG